jgi:hypothetical protein
MHRSSESVGSIATALAKAQTELTNPEKSMVGTIYHHNRGDNPQTFRYAPLSGGLEIVRKVLGGQQIAVAQTTDVDRVNGLINLTTILMHTSGEWISSDWPVCALSEASAPRRMGAALTYARRYALFTLVGIAGEDDLDAPDLQDDRPASAQPQIPASLKVDPLPEGNPESTFKAQHFPGKPNAVLLKETLSAEESNLIRTQLQAEIDAFTTIDDPQARAIEILKAKNRLLPDDARLIETAFTAKMAILQQQVPQQDAIAPGAPAVSDAIPSLDSKPGSVAPVEPPPKRRGRPPKNGASNPARALPTSLAETKTTPITTSPPIVTATSLSEKPMCDSKIVRLTIADLHSKKIDKSELTFGELRRKRDKMHLRFVALQPCLICGRVPSDAHHLRFAQPRAMGRKTSDEFTVPLCRTHHRDNHRVGNEVAWWARAAIDPIEVSQKFWKLSRGVPPD